ncbi:MAG: methyltransferase domain-containing protein [Pseudomonadota bacterium]
MSEEQKSGVINFYDTHPINEDAILTKAAAQGASMHALTQADLKDFDQDHYGGTEILDALADASGIGSQHYVLDVCSGMGGPARWLAHKRQCRVTGLDFTSSRVEGAKRLTERVKLQHLVNFVHGDATAMPLPNSRYDFVISQEAWLHIPDKSALISECVRVLKPGGIVAFTDIVINSALGFAAEQRLAAEMHAVNILAPNVYAALFEENGCLVIRQDDLSAQWKNILNERLEMYRSLRDTTVAKFGESRFVEYDDAYSHYVNCFTENKLGGVRIVARKAE